MLTLEIRLNSGLISTIYIINKGYVNGTLTNCIYDYELYEVGNGKELKRGKVVHDRKLGALNLIKIICEDVER